MLRDPSLIPLSHQHQHGLALAVIIDRGLKADPSERKAEELSHKVARLAEVELLGHFKVEEEVLFPAVRPFFGSEEIIDELIAEHRQMEELLQRLAQAPASDRRALLREFGPLLSSHIRTEERQLFEQIQQRLSGEDLLELGKQIDASVQKVCPVTGKLPWEETS